MDQIKDTELRNTQASYIEVEFDELIILIEDIIEDYNPEESDRFKDPYFKDSYDIAMRAFWTLMKQIKDTKWEAVYIDRIEHLISAIITIR